MMMLADDCCCLLMLAAACCCVPLLAQSFQGMRSPGTMELLEVRSCPHQLTIQSERSRPAGEACQIAEIAIGLMVRGIGDCPHLQGHRQRSRFQNFRMGHKPIIQLEPHSYHRLLPTIGGIYSAGIVWGPGRGGTTNCRTVDSNRESTWYSADSRKGSCPPLIDYDSLTVKPYSFDAGT